MARKAALAWELGDPNLLIWGNSGSDSRVLMHRSLADRIKKVAPFLTLDAAGRRGWGQIYWMQDAYTTSGRFPYAQHLGATNYIRNSVKIVTNALTGDMTFYLMEPNDPIAATWAKIFPSCSPPPARCRQTCRRTCAIPRTCSGCSRLYLKYHINDPRVFFVR